MQTITEVALERATRGVFTREQAALWVGSYGARLNALLKRAVAGGEIWRIRRGLYCLSDRYTPLEWQAQLADVRAVFPETYFPAAWEIACEGNHA